MTIGGASGLPTVRVVQQPTTKLAASGHRFLTRRLETALLGGDVDGPHDPVRAQSTSLAAGALLAAVVVAVSLVLAHLRPQPTLGDAPIAVDRESGALYVRVGEVMHPVLNLASARLIAGVDATPVAVSAAQLAAVPRGALLGIPGAPGVISPALSPEESGWSVCEQISGSTQPPTRTVVVVGTVRPGESPVLLVTVSGDSTAPSFLIYDGHRAAVDLADPVVVRALGAEGVAPQVVSAGFLNLVPEWPAIVVPPVPSGPSALAGFASGSVVRGGSDGENFVLLPDGVQRIGQVAAELLRSADSGGGATAVSLAPDVFTALPIVESLPVSTYPDVVQTPVGALAVCAGWSPDGTTDVWRVDALPQGVVELAQSDGAGPAVDGVMVPRGRSAFVSTGAGLHVVTETGVSFGIAGPTEATHLGLGGTAVAAPSPVLRMLPRGPELSRPNALVARDTIEQPR